MTKKMTKKRRICKIEKKFEKEQLKRKFTNISWGIAKNLTDFTLFFLFFSSSLTLRGKYAQKGIKDLFESSQDIDWGKIRKVLARLKKEGFISYSRSRILEPQITSLGLKRIKKSLPSYEVHRPWDKKIYLITYDIPEKEKKERDRLRNFLINLGCGMLQASVWLTPYNPKKLVSSFIKQNKIKGSIIVSDVGKDGNIGKKDLRRLLSKVYELEKLNEKYKVFLDNIGKGRIKKTHLGFAFLSILKDDPQLPFELLPDDWLGEKAYFLYQKKIAK
jgi:phenylacetic acid degradation operon negative regulatory protein